MKAGSVLVRNYSERGRASHVNTGTAIAAEDLPMPEGDGRVFRWPKVRSEVAQDTGWTPFGGLALVVDFLRLFRVPQLIDKTIEVLRYHFPYHESDHVLAAAMNLYVGGTCIEDLSRLQRSPGIKTLVGGIRIPDPTTAGDFLRRFQDSKNPGSLEDLGAVTDTIQDQVWEELDRRERKLQKQKQRLKKLRDRRPRGRVRQGDAQDAQVEKTIVVLDLDGHIKEVCGNQKEGADFSYNGKWSFQVLTASIAGTGECLALHLSSGSDRSSEPAASVVDRILPRLLKRYDHVLVRADSDFDRSDLLDVCRRYKGVYFAIVGREHKGRPDTANAIPESKWEGFIPRARRLREERENAEGFQPRKKKENLRKRRAQERGYKNLQQLRQWMVELPVERALSDRTVQKERLVIRRELIEVSQGQQFLFEQYRYHYIVTNLPATYSTCDVIDETYRRCDQENVIEQFGSGLAAWRLPVAEFEGNCAWLQIARLAWNLAKWIALMALPAEVVRWEWKRFRYAFVYLAAKVYTRSRQVIIRFTESDPFVEALLAGRLSLQR